MSDGRGRGITVTIKYGQGYEDTWGVFHGLPTEVREDIITYFGFPAEAVAGLTLSELVVEATNLAHGKGNIAAMLGATIIPQGDSDPLKADYSGEDPWSTAAQQSTAQAAPAPAPAKEDPNAWILGEIEKASTVPDLKRLWAENQSFFSDQTVMAAWKARGKALSS